MKDRRMNKVVQAEVDETTVESFICRDCSQSFQSKQYNYYGKPLVYPRVCPSCVTKLEQAQKDLEKQTAQTHKDYLLRQKAEKWAGLCPWEFRTKQEGGNTCLDRLSKECPKWKVIASRAYGPRGYTIKGDTRKCKTRSMWRLMRKFFEEGFTITALTASQFHRQCGDAGGTHTLSSWFKRLAEVEVLFIDDLGTGHWTDHTEANFFDLIDERTRKGLPIMVTTMDTGESLTGRLTPGRGEALVRRLRDYNDNITL